jgi:hypothetical protein
MFFPIDCLNFMDQAGSSSVTSTSNATSTFGARARTSVASTNGGNIEEVSIIL